MKKLRIILAMIIVGTIGIFVEYIGLPSLVIATARAFGGAFFMLAVMFFLRKKVHPDKVKKNAFFLIIGTILILGSTLLCETPLDLRRILYRKQKTHNPS